MRALLVNPWIYDFAAYDLWSKPLGLLTIAAHLEALGVDIGFVDCLDRLHLSLERPDLSFGGQVSYGDGRYHTEEIEKPAVLKDIPRSFKRYGLPIGIFEALLDREPEPDVILVTTGMTYWYPAYVDTIAIMKRRFRAPVVLGGNYVNLCPEHAKRTSGADIVFRGLDITAALETVFSAAKWRKPAGLAERRGKYVFPAYDLYASLEYVTLRTSDGCPFRCTYCGSYLLNEKFAHHDHRLVLDGIEYFRRNKGVTNFAFYDDALLYKADEHLLPLMEGIISREIDAHFHTPNGLHNRLLTAGIAGLMKRAGFVRPRLALETSSSARQSSTGGKTTNGDFLAALGHLCRAGYSPGDIGAYILIGLPGEDRSEVEESIRFAAKYGVRLFLEEYSPIPGTVEYGRAGLDEDADPLLHNNSANSIRSGGAGPTQAVKSLARGLNASAPSRAGREAARTLSIRL